MNYLSNREEPCSILPGYSALRFRVLMALLFTSIVIFIIIVLIQFLVITKGATRVSEVAARFEPQTAPDDAGLKAAIDKALG